MRTGLWAALRIWQPRWSSNANYTYFARNGSPTVPTLLSSWLGCPGQCGPAHSLGETCSSTAQASIAVPACGAGSLLKGDLASTLPGHLATVPDVSPLSLSWPLRSSKMVAGSSSEVPSPPGFPHFRTLLVGLQCCWLLLVRILCRFVFICMDCLCWSCPSPVSRPPRLPSHPAYLTHSPLEL